MNKVFQTGRALLLLTVVLGLPYMLAKLFNYKSAVSDWEDERRRAVLDTMMSVPDIGADGHLIWNTPKAPIIPPEPTFWSTGVPMSAWFGVFLLCVTLIAVIIGWLRIVDESPWVAKAFVTKGFAGCRWKNTEPEATADTVEDYPREKCRNGACPCATHTARRFNTHTVQWEAFCRDFDCRCLDHDGEVFNLSCSRWTDPDGVDEADIYRPDPVQPTFGA